MNTDVAERAVRMAVAATVTAYPDADFHTRLDTLRAQHLSATGADLPPAVAELQQIPADDLASLYLSTFELGAAANPLHGTSYGQGQGPARGNVLADISAFYLAFGLASGGSTMELADHLAVQLEFYSVLLLKLLALDEGGDVEGVEVVRAAQAGFLRDHLGPLAQAAADVEVVTAQPVYGAALRWVRDCVMAECAACGVEPGAAQRFTMEPEPDTVACMTPARLPVLASN